MNNVRDFIFKHISKLVPFLFFCIVFAVWLFPYESITSLITQKVYDSTKIYLDFETPTDPEQKSIELVLVPDPGLRLNKLNVIGDLISEISVESVVIFPNLKSPLSGISVLAEKLFGGEMHLRYSQDKDSAQNKEAVLNHEFQVRGSAIALSEVGSYLSKLFNKNYELNGALDLKAQINSSTQFGPNGNILLKDQPTGTLELTIKKATAAVAQLVPSMAGFLSEPILRIEEMSLKTQMEKGKLQIKDGRLNAPGLLTGTFEGEADLTLQQVGNQIVPNFGKYSLLVDLTFAPTKPGAKPNSLKARISNPDQPGGMPKFEPIN